MTTQIEQINILVWIVLFIISIVYDILYTKSVLYISRLNAVGAANLSVLLYVMMSYGIINFIENIFNIIPIILGSWLGTYGILKFEKHQKNKKEENKEKNVT